MEKCVVGFHPKSTTLRRSDAGLEGGALIKPSQSSDCIYQAFRRSKFVVLRHLSRLVPRFAHFEKHLQNLAEKLGAHIAIRGACGDQYRFYHALNPGSFTIVLTIDPDWPSHICDAAIDIAYGSSFGKTHHDVQLALPFGTKPKSVQKVVKKSAPAKKTASAPARPQPQVPRSAVVDAITQEVARGMQLAKRQMSFKADTNASLDMRYAAMMVCPGKAELVPVPDGARKMIKIFRQKTLVPLLYQQDAGSNYHSQVMALPAMRDHLFQLGLPPQGALFTLLNLTPDSTGSLIDSTVQARKAGQAGQGFTTLPAAYPSATTSSLPIKTGVAYPTPTAAQPSPPCSIIQASTLRAQVTGAPTSIVAYPGVTNDVVNCVLVGQGTAAQNITFGVTWYNSSGTGTNVTNTLAIPASGAFNGSIGITLPANAVGWNNPVLTSPANSLDLDQLQVTFYKAAAPAANNSLPRGYMNATPIHDYTTLASQCPQVRCSAMSLHIRDTTAVIAKAGQLAAARICEYVGPSDIIANAATVSDYEGLAEYPECYCGQFDGEEQGFYGVLPLSDPTSLAFRTSQQPMYFDVQYLTFSGLQPNIAASGSSYSGRVIVESVWEVDSELQVLAEFSGHQSSEALQRVRNAVFVCDILGDNPGHWARIANFLRNVGGKIAGVASKAGTFAPLLAAVPGIGPELAAAANTAGVLGKAYQAM